MVSGPVQSPSRRYLPSACDRHWRDGLGLIVDQNRTEQKASYNLVHLLDLDRDVWYSLSAKLLEIPGVINRKIILEPTTQSAVCKLIHVTHVLTRAYDLVRASTSRRVPKPPRISAIQPPWVPHLWHWPRTCQSASGVSLSPFRRCSCDLACVRAE
jgi:hypothetical protein